MADNVISYLLDLDSSDFQKKITSSIERVEGLAEAFGSVVKVAGLVGIAFLSIKAAIDLTIEGEKINALHKQFDILAEKAGIAGEEMLLAMQKASKGTIEETELLKIGSRAIVELGQNAEKSGEIMGLSFKIAKVFGKEAKDVFEDFSQAIATGRTRQLAHMGIIIDSQKAIKDYAKELGIAENSLSKAGERQAIMNAVLKESHKQYDALKSDSDTTSKSFSRIGVAFSEMGELLARAVEKTIGPVIRSLAKTTADVAIGMADSAKQIFTSFFGSDAQKAQKEVNNLESSIAFAQRQLEMFQSGMAKSGDPKAIAGYSKAADEISGKIDVLQTKLDLAKQKLEAAKPEEGTANAPKDIIDQEQVKKNTAQFNKDMLALRTERMAADIAVNDQMTAVGDIQNAQKLLIEEQLAARIADIRLSAHLDSQQKDAEIIQARETSAARIQQIEEQTLAMRLSALDKYQEHSTSVGDGVARAFEAGAQRASLAQNNFGAVGQRVFKSFENNSTSALQAFGAGTKSAADAAKGFIFGMLADEAEARGKLMLLASIFPPNPLGIAAGAGLIALSGFLRSQGGGGGGGGGGGAAGGGAGGSPSASSASLEGRPEVAREMEKKAVGITIMGSLYETEQTKTRLVEMIRESSDATSFEIKNIGG